MNIINKTVAILGNSGGESAVWYVLSIYINIVQLFRSYVLQQF